jgi:hypothetical protein
MEVIKDFLPEDMFKEFYDVYTGYNRVRWAYHNQANSESSDLGNFQFINLLYDARFEEMEVDVQTLALLQHLPNGFKSVIRSKANLFTIRDEPIEYGWHVDTDIDNFKTLLYYINTNNGGTAFETGEFVKSEQNTAVVVDGNIHHQSVGQTDTNVRLLININYLET